MESSTIIIPPISIKLEKEEHFNIFLLDNQERYQLFPKPVIKVENIKIEPKSNAPKNSSKAPKSKIQCKTCPKNFVNKASYLKHIRKHETGIEALKPFSCDLCDKRYPKKCTLRIHMETSHKYVDECKICNKKLRYGKLEKHMIVYHTTECNFQCDICDKKFKLLKFLKNHKNIHNKVHECKICGKKFSAKYHRDQHELKHRPKEFKIFECKLCGMRFTQLSHFTTHERNHKTIKRQKSLKCFRCNFSTNLKNSLKIHQRGHELKDKKAAEIKNPVNCEKCPAVLRNKQALRNHMTNCHPVAPYECDLCGRVINAKSNFTKHINYHLNINKIKVE